MHGSSLFLLVTFNVSVLSSFSAFPSVPTDFLRSLKKERWCWHSMKVASPWCFYSGCVFHFCTSTTNWTTTTERWHKHRFSQLLPRDMAPMSRYTCFPEASFIPCWHVRGAHAMVLRGTWRRPAQPPWEGRSHFKEGTKETDGLGKSILATGPKTHSLRSNWRASWSGQTEHGSIN